MTDILATCADLPNLLDAVRAAELATAEAQAAVLQVKNHIADQEDTVTAEALEAEGLTNDAKRKAAVAKALREDPVLQKLRANLFALQHTLAATQVELADAERRVKGAQHTLGALGQLAGLEAAKLQLQANQAYLQAARTQLETRKIR